MLVNLNDIMKIAEEKQIAVGSFNTPNMESLTAVISAAEELKLPVIVQFAQCHESWMPLEVIGPVMLDVARRSSVPVCVHLDHGETVGYVRQALELGFTSVMYDGSVLPYEENLANTKKIVELAAETSASVEAELGSMGKRESGTGDGSGEEDTTKIYTNPQQAAEFVKASGIDALACSFGTTHGIYLTEPKLDFEIVKSVRAFTNHIPVVMHGGSGVSREDYKKAIEAGVRKINYFTYMDKAGGQAAAEYVKTRKENDSVFFSAISMVARDAIKENVKQAMKMFALTD